MSHSQYNMYYVYKCNYINLTNKYIAWKKTNDIIILYFFPVYENKCLAVTEEWLY